MDEHLAARSRLAAVRTDIAAACAAAGRDPSSVTLIAVSKTFAAEAIAPVIAAGQQVFGGTGFRRPRPNGRHCASGTRRSRCSSSGLCNRTRRAKADALFEPSGRRPRRSRRGAGGEIARAGRQPAGGRGSTAAAKYKGGVLPEAADAILRTCRETPGLPIPD
jgi:hypothetical protein